MYHRLRKTRMPHPDTREIVLAAPAKTRTAPLWHVILLNDDDHSYEYVIEMLGKLFHHPVERAFLLAREVDVTGRAVVETTVLERAEFKRDQIHAFGPDLRIARCQGSMSAVLEPVPA